MQDNEDVKVILLHGGKIYSSGNDLTAFSDFGKVDIDVLMKRSEDGVKIKMAGMCMAMAKSVKPIVLVSRGLAFGIAFTHQTHATFIYGDETSKW